jgi:serine protease inhibitor
MKRVSKAKLAVAAGLAMLAGSFMAGEAQGQRAGEKRAQAPQEVLALSAANNRFGMDMLARMHEPGKNTFMSPTSIAQAMQMVTAGADGNTLAELNKVMYIEGKPLNAANRGLIAELNNRSGVTLNVANSYWAAEGRLELADDYIAAIRNDFGGEIRNVSFSDPQTRLIINKWVAERTNDLIKNLIQDLSPQTISVLVNAIYFKGDWTKPFKEEDTKDAQFRMAGGATKDVRMMSRTESMRYGEHEGNQIIMLPYGPDETAFMMIVLPAEDGNVDKLAQGMTLEHVGAWQRAARSRPGTLKLPRFKVSFRDENLANHLQQLGVKDAFSVERADFSRMGKSPEGPLFISQVIHEAVVIVDEKGTEAAAATAVVMRAGSAPPVPFNMTCDRPFLFMIVDQPSSSIMFMGVVHDPENP